MSEINKRQLIAGMAVTPLASSAVSAAAISRKPWDVIVVGAGVFGAWTAEMLRRAGKKVLLVDAWAPAHARASSGGESRLTRGGYGQDAVYTQMASDSLAEWVRLSRDAGLPLFHQAGVLAFFDKETDYAAGSLATMQELNLPVERIEPEALAQRWPQFDWSGVAFGLYEPGFGALMARRGVATLVANFVNRGGVYRQAAIEPPTNDSPLTSLKTRSGDTLEAEQYVFACGPWLAKLFPELLGERLFATRQEIFFFRPPPGDTRFTASAMPGWIDFQGGDAFYGFPDLEGRGFKIADDKHGPPADFDANDRAPSAEGLAAIRAYMARRFPAMADAPLSETRVCQYENSANGDFLIDRHPDWSNTALVGMGSGHGFKHGPSVGKLAAQLVTGGGAPNPRFSLTSKTTRQDRSVH
ncbi:MAG: FAD-dependent oxidoreductase [Pseudomonadota bacterium]|nr:FAD-dependent oxidoreductase [Pseudomonadota bacterium]